MNNKLIQRIILAGIIIHDDKVLLLQRNHNEDVYPDMWELPSGKKEFLEGHNKALLREVKEESGLNVEIVMPVSVFDYKIEKSGEIFDSVQINFLLKSIGDLRVVLSDEHQAFAWLSLADLEKYNISKETKNVIVKGFELFFLLQNR